mgnify:CR=1 FL=1
MKKIFTITLLLISLTVLSQVRTQNVRNGLTDSEIRALTGVNVGDLYTSTDTNKVFKVAADGIAYEYTDKEVVYVANEKVITESEPIHTITQNLGITTIDSRTSKYNGLEVGGSNGKHKYTFTGLKNTVDVLGTATDANLVAGLNTDLVNGVASKNIAGNTWNSSVYSQESFDPNVLDFAVTVEIESITGTIKEMFGLDDNPTQNNSYSSIEYAVYQVNSYFYSYIYEKGQSKKIDGYTTFYFQVGDYVGVKCVNGIVSYFVLRSGVETIITTSKVVATTPLYFKAAFNRGNTSSGASVLGGVKFYTAQRQDTFSINIEGNATDLISETDKETLKDNAGVEMLTGSTYSKLDFNRSTTQRFNNGLYPLDLSHIYIGLEKVKTTQITF